ncbi:MAG: hypothetical protein ACHQCI_02210 [Solirubrobacterales bacterium]
MYAAIGKLVVRTLIFYVRHAYRRQIRVGAATAALAIGVAAYLASRNVPEG